VSRQISCLFWLLFVVVVLPARVPAQTYNGQILASFTSPGQGPYGLIQASDGNFYGTTEFGGDISACNTEGCGTVFRLTPSDTLTTVYTFCAQDGVYCTYEDGPTAIVEGGDGNFYAAAEAGIIFKLTASGTLTALTDAVTSINGVIQDQAGNFYGASIDGGVNGGGFLFKITPSGTLTMLYSFCGQTDCTDGKYPYGRLIQGSDGNFYGTTDQGGANNNGGTVFKMTPTGSLATLYSFCSQDVDICLDGQEPLAGLVEGADGNFYGSTAEGGTGSNLGTIFKITPGGALTTLYSFGTSGWGAPETPMLAGADGNFYGTTGSGSMFQITPQGVLTTLFDFASLGSGEPSSITQGSNGSFYGTAGDGGVGTACPSGGCGLVYELSTSPSLPGPAQLSVSQSTVALGNSVTFTWQVLNAYSLTLQQCYAFVQNNAAGAGTWTGLQAGSVMSGIYTGSATITPTDQGTFTYALTCGGAESGFATVNVAQLPVATTTSLITNTPILIGSLATLTATVASQQNFGAATGSVTFSIGSTPLGTVPVANQSASLSLETSGLPGGTYPVTATYSGDSNYRTSTTTSNIVVQGYPTLTTLSISTGTVTLDQSVTLSSAVSRTAGTVIPNGTVTFTAGTQVIGSVPLNAGTASLTLTPGYSIPPGAYSVTATYSGDATDQASTSGATNVSVVAATANALSITPSTVQSGQSVTFTDKVSRVGAGGTATGTVAFYSTEQYLGEATLNGGVATLTLANNGSLAVGTYSVTAYYDGDSADLKSTSSAVPITVEQPALATSTSLTVMPAALTQGQSATLSCTISGGNGSPTGTVSFYYGTLLIGKAPVANAAASYTAATNGNIAAGVYQLTAIYSGDANNQPSTSAPVDVTLLAATSIALTITPNPVPVDSAVTLAATVKQLFGSAIPTGTITFTAGGEFAGTATLNASGTAVTYITVFGIPAGTYPIVATYSGDSGNAASAVMMNVVIQ